MTAPTPTALSLALLAAGALASTAGAQTTLYVDANLTTGANDGSSWANAYQGPLGLQDAITAAVSGDEVWVADGLYHPAAPGGARTTSFRPKNGVAIRGGFLGGEASAAARPAFGSAPAILSGDLNDNDGANFTNQGDNSFHVINAQGTNATAIVEGFTVTAGAATSSGGNNDRGGGILCLSGTAPTILDCDFVGNRCTFGGGAGYVNGAPRFTRCSFDDNRGGSFGGAFDIAGAGAIAFDQCTFERNTAVRAGALEVFSTANASITNCFFKDNVATGGSGGGGLWFGNGGSSLVANCTIIENRANSQAQGGIRVQGSNPRIVNCILWGNTGSGGAMGGVNQVTTSANVDHCLVMGGFAGGTGNISTAPTFVDAAGGDYRLAAGSAGLDAGDSTAVPAGVELDLAGRGRLRDDPATADTGVASGLTPVVDIGAYEFQAGAVGIAFCSNTVNSQSVSAVLSASGSEVASDNDVTLTASGLPLNQFGLLAVSRTADMIPFAGGSQGTLCLGGGIGRYNGQVTNSGPMGTFDLALDLTSIPTPNGIAAAMAGDTWIFQVWYRDNIFGIPVSNFTSALRIEFQ